MYSNLSHPTPEDTISDPPKYFGLEGGLILKEALSRPPSALRGGGVVAQSIVVTNWVLGSEVPV